MELIISLKKQLKAQNNTTRWLFNKEKVSIALFLYNKRKIYRIPEKLLGKKTDYDTIVSDM
jgi:hypothetical protein